jgi:ATP-binding cassette subfamily B protein RaxB
MTEGLIEGVVDGFISILMVIAMFTTSLKIALVIVSSSFIYGVTRYYYNNKAHQYHDEMLYARSMELSYFMETLRAVPAIKIFCKEDDRLTKWSAKFVCSINSMTCLTRHKIIFDSIKNGIFGLDFVVVLGLGCLYLEKLNLSLGVLYALLAYRQQFIAAVINLADKIQEYKSLKLHLNRLDDIISEPIERNDFKKRDFDAASLTLDNISYSYALDVIPTLKQVNLQIKAKECVVITGPSGCGKTTLLKVMMGLLSPTAGCMLVDSISVYPYYVSSYRKKIASVLQADILLSGTIKENISFFSSIVDHEHVDECAKLAGIRDEIHALPMGFDTFVGDMGSVLSGGQKQRILLARAFYARPKILFLDEATSHLDVNKELEVNQAIRSLGITVIMIAHRKETINMADRVIHFSDFE